MHTQDALANAQRIRIIIVEFHHLCTPHLKRDCLNDRQIHSPGGQSNNSQKLAKRLPSVVNSPFNLKLPYQMKDSQEGDDNDMLSQSQTRKKKLKKTTIDHSYVDYSQHKIVSSSGPHPHGQQQRNNFPAKLHEIVSNPDYQHIICWLPHGRSWKILNKRLLERVICPKHFSHCKFESFNRQVNGWGFKVSRHWVRMHFVSWCAELFCFVPHCVRA